MTSQRYKQLLIDSEREFKTRLDNSQIDNEASFKRTMNAAKRHLRLSRAYKRKYIKQLECNSYG